MLALEPVSADRIDEDQDHEGVDRALLSDPEAERELPDRVLVQPLDPPHTASKRHDEPDRQENEDQALVSAPKCLAASLLLGD